MKRMLTISGLCLIPLIALGQISQGGTPPSFSLSLAATQVPVAQMAPVDAVAYLAEDAQAAKDEPYRFAASLDVSLNLNNSGIWESVPGGRLWRLQISSPGAYSIGLVYDQWHIPEGGQLFIYNVEASQVVGAFTSFNNWMDGTNITQPVAGDVTILEYFEPSTVYGQSALSISQVAHAYRNLFGRPDALDNYGDSGACNNNVNCPEGDLWQTNKRGAAMILTSGGSRLCSGSLVNNTAQDQTPYYLTANHCLGGHSTWMFMFNYESPGCANQDGPTNQTVANSTLRANWSGSDFALLQLSSNVPESYEPYFNGWNKVDSAATNSVCIHHPSGDIKKITFDIHAPISDTWSGTPPNSHWRIATWEDGTTEPGSSGSPLFDQNHRITGQLHGGVASCSNNIDDYYGKFSLSWPGNGSNSTRLSNWLDPTNSGVTVLDGLDGAIPPPFSVTTPDGGELWAVDSTVSVTWIMGSVAGNIHIELSRDGAGGPWETLIASTPNDGTQTFTATGPATTQARVRITSLDTPDSTDMSDADFSIATLLVVLSADMEDGAPGWTHSTEGTWMDQWHISTERANSPTHSYKNGDAGAGNYANRCDARLLSPTIANLPSNATLAFYHQIQSELSGAFPDSAYDGGVLEVSVNGGAFALLTPVGGYPKTFRRSAGGGNPYSGPMPGVPCFAGSITNWTRVEASLAAYAGQSVQLRFRFGSDNGGANEGWYVDDIAVYAPVSITVPQNLTAYRIVDNIVLQWANDDNPFYRIYSSTSPDGSFETLEGSTTQNVFTVPGGIGDALKFFIVVGWDGN